MRNFTTSNVRKTILNGTYQNHHFPFLGSDVNIASKHFFLNQFRDLYHSMNNVNKLNKEVSVYFQHLETETIEPRALTEESTVGQNKAIASWLNTTKNCLTNTYIQTYFPGPVVKSWPNQQNNNNSTNYTENRISPHLFFESPRFQRNHKHYSSTAIHYTSCTHRTHKSLKEVTAGNS